MAIVPLLPPSPTGAAPLSQEANNYTGSGSVPKPANEDVDVDLYEVLGRSRKRRVRKGDDKNLLRLAQVRAFEVAQNANVKGKKF